MIRLEFLIKVQNIRANISQCKHSWIDSVKERESERVNAVGSDKGISVFVI